MKYYGKISKRGETSFFSSVEADDSKTAKEIMQSQNKGWKITGFGEYLIESKMYHFLKEYYPVADIIYDQPLSDESLLTKNINPDFRFESVELKGETKKLIIEFDGPQHYTKALEVLKDKVKDDIYRQKGYEIIRFPYFIQLTEEIVKHYFGGNLAFDNSYKHGFVDKDAPLPSDFCELGIERFMNEIEYYNSISPTITTSIIETLKEKIASKTKSNNKWENIISESVIREKYQDELKKYGW